MTEIAIRVCDVCGKPDAELIQFRVGSRDLEKDVRQDHLEILLRNARPMDRILRAGSSPDEVRSR